ncbi:hypothetical protein GQ600_16780 [Phytophthora cactorum]|nr:hypothetical protein GQ600_16780 [Phytophthora cactorum]
MQEILSAKSTVEEHGPIVVDTVEANLDVRRGCSCARATLEMLRVSFLSRSTNGLKATYNSIDIFFRDPYEANRQVIDSLLLTATLWNLESGSELLPRYGTVVDIDEYSNFQFCPDTQCHLTTRVSQLNWEISDL